jgi:hypothetical protein
MGRSFIEKRYQHQPPPMIGPRTTPAPKPRLGRGLLGWIIFFGITALLFLYINNPARHPPNKAAPPPYTPTDFIALGTVALGVVLFFGLVTFAIRLGRRSLKIESWRFDDEGIHTVQADGEHTMTWEWISNVTPTKAGIVIERNISATRLFPNSAFNNDAEKQAFLDTYARRGIRAAKQVQDDGSRGFAV